MLVFFNSNVIINNYNIYLYQGVIPAVQVDVLYASQINIIKMVLYVNNVYQNVKNALMIINVLNVQEIIEQVIFPTVNVKQDIGMIL